MTVIILAKLDVRLAAISKIFEADDDNFQFLQTYHVWYSRLDGTYYSV